MRLPPFRSICASRTCAYISEAHLSSAWKPAPPPRPPQGSFNFYISILNQCAAEKSLSQTKRVHLHMKQTGFPHLNLGNKLIAAYLNSGSIDDARKVFDDMPQPHVVSWSSMISSYIRQQRNQEAVALYKRMLIESVVPDEFTFSSIFRAFSDLRLVNGGRAAHGQLVALGLQAENVYVSSALVDFYAKFGRLREARVAYDSAKPKDVVLTTALIVAYTQSGEDRQALEIFRQMASICVKANDFTFASVLIACGNLKNLASGRLIHGAIIKSGFCSWIAPQTSLLTMYSKCGLIEDSLEVFNGILNPNTVAWTAIIGCLLHSRREEQALSMFRRMILNSVTPNAFTLSTALGVCSSLALLEQGMLIHACALKTGLVTNRFVVSALVDAYGKCGHVRMARLVFDSLPAPDLVSLNSLINGYGQCGNGEEAIRLFHMAERLGLEPKAATYVNVLSACSNSGMLEEGRRVFSSMLADHRRPRPSNEHYACMVDLLGRAGRLDEAGELSNQVQKPDKVVWRTLLGACKVHGRLDMAERAASKVFELDPGDEATHILLCNMYASLGRWKEVINIKCVMRDMGLKKEAAASWIRVDKEIHTFMAGDQCHPNGELVYRELEELMEKTKCLGYVPDTRFVLQEMGELEKERSLFYHSEKLAVAFGVLSSRGKAWESITIFKNLRVCGDCHNWMKLVSKVTGKEIIARDAKRFHHYRDGLCSCGDYW